MSISCGCDFNDCGDWQWCEAEDFSSMPKRKRRARCYSCKKLLNEGDTVLELFRNTCDVMGEERPLASWFVCEECGEILLNLLAAGMCVYLDNDVHADLKAYQVMMGFIPEKYKEAGDDR